MELMGYLLAVAIGISLGLIGGGGSILTIPVLVYFFDVEPVQAGGYSLFVVGASSLAGVVPKFRQREVDFKTAVIFGLPSLLAVIITRRYLLPAIPQELFTVSGYTVTRSSAMMILFALLMLLAGRSMLKGVRTAAHRRESRVSKVFMLVLQGASVGTVTGLLGAGGGFLIIPALVMLCDLPMKTAVGTSLLIIAINSFVGFFGNWPVTAESVDWILLASITSLAIAGIFIGSQLGRNITGSKLRKGFALFVLALATVILFSEMLPILV